MLIKEQARILFIKFVRAYCVEIPDGEYSDIRVIMDAIQGGFLTIHEDGKATLDPGDGLPPICFRRMKARDLIPYPQRCAEAISTLEEINTPMEILNLLRAHLKSIEAEEGFSKVVRFIAVASDQSVERVMKITYKAFCIYSAVVDLLIGRSANETIQAKKIV